MKMENDVLTTSQAARLLGISVRTAQLLVEGGSLTSWKTPGGHRRVYRADVMALMKHPPQLPAARSAVVFVLASPDRLPLYARAISAVAGSSAELHSDVYAAALALGARIPAAVIVDLDDDTAERLGFLRHLSATPTPASVRVLVVGGPADPSLLAGLAHPTTRVRSPEQLPVALGAALADSASILEDVPPGIPVAPNEGQRLQALQRSGLVDTAPEKSFDRLTRLAGNVLAMPVSLMTLLTPTRQWFKSRQGIDLTETPRSWAFCNQTILQRDVFVVEDLTRDKRYADNPAVDSAPYFRFYAGAPVIDPDGFALGSVCVMDYKPRQIDREQSETLSALAALASDQLRLRATERELRWAMNELNRPRKP
jgi:excisionase family DNA binding protein